MGQNDNSFDDEWLEFAWTNVVETGKRWRVAERSRVICFVLNFSNLIQLFTGLDVAFEISLATW